MDLEARPYRYFVAIAEKGSFRAAAAALNVSQPALSAQIRELERRLGFALFARSSRRVALTAEGARFLGNARRMILETEFLNRAARDIRINPLRVGTAHFTNQIPERLRLIDAFIGRHPDLPLNIVGAQHAQLFQGLRERAIDVAITLVPRPDGEASAVEDDGLGAAGEQISCGARRVELLLPAEHTLSRYGRIPLAALAGCEIGTISRAHGIGLTERAARLLHAAKAVPLRVPEGDATALMRYGAVRRLPVIDLGWFPLPAELPGGAMVRRPVEGWDVIIDLLLVRRREAGPAALELFWQAAVDGVVPPSSDPARILLSPS